MVETNLEKAELIGSIRGSKNEGANVPDVRVFIGYNEC